MKNIDVVENSPTLASQLTRPCRNIHKFGGSSLATAECIKRVLTIICQNCQINDVIVVSANGKTTDALFALYELATIENGCVDDALKALYQAQAELIDSLLNASTAVRLIEQLSADIHDISAALTEHATSFENDLLAYGELWSARLLSAVLGEQVCPSYIIDARDFLLLEDEQNISINYATSTEKYQQLEQANKLAVVTGYIAKNADLATVTLGRNGSDYSATIISALIKASNVTLWTDVDGIYSADPRVVPLARKLHRLPNVVAKELGRLGNPVLHAKTLKPLVEHNTHLHVASSFAPKTSGSEIGEFGQIAKQELSVTYLNDLILAKSVSFKGESGELAISTFSPICADIDEGFVVVEQSQQKPLSQWLASHDTEVSFKPVAIIAIVGYKVAKQAAMRARFKRALKGQTSLHFVPAYHQHSYIAVLPEACTSERLNNIHHHMTKDARNIAILVAGIGNIGSRFLEMLPLQIAKIPALENLHLVGLIGSEKALINTDGIEPNQALVQYQKYAKNYCNDELTHWLENHPYDELVIVDITASEQFSTLYADFFQQGIHVISANKWAGSSETTHYNKLLSVAAQKHSLWLTNTTVGAGLPINNTISELVESGDQIVEISGIFSGTLSWLFQYYDGKLPFSTLLADAQQQGLTEPDPRDDLSGKDVQRKLLILARIAGFDLSLDDIECQNLVPINLQSLSFDEFIKRSHELDEYFASCLNKAKQNHGVIRYVARFKCQQNEHGKKITAKVSLESLPATDTFSQLTPCDNVFQIKSLWYQDNPLIIRGPGAGRDVTAGGIHADLVKLCQQLNLRQPQVKINSLGKLA